MRNVFVVCLFMVVVVISSGNAFSKESCGDDVKSYEWRGISIPCRQELVYEMDKERDALSVHRHGNDNNFLMFFAGGRMSPNFEQFVQEIKSSDKYISHRFLEIDGERVLEVSVKFDGMDRGCLVKQFYVENSTVFVGYYGDKNNFEYFFSILNETKLPNN